MYRFVGLLRCSPFWVVYYIYWWFLDAPIETLNRRPYLSGGTHRDWPATIVAWLLMLVLMGVILGIILLLVLAVYTYRW